jgi:hypothetical protein
MPIPSKEQSSQQAFKLINVLFYDRVSKYSRASKIIEAGIDALQVSLVRLI